MEHLLIAITVIASIAVSVGISAAGLQVLINAIAPDNEKSRIL